MFLFESGCNIKGLHREQFGGWKGKESVVDNAPAVVVFLAEAVIGCETVLANGSRGEIGESRWQQCRYRVEIDCRGSNGYAEGESGAGGRCEQRRQAIGYESGRGCPGCRNFVARAFVNYRGQRTALLVKGEAERDKENRNRNRPISTCARLRERRDQDRADTNGLGRFCGMDAKGAVDEVLFLGPTWSVVVVRALGFKLSSTFAARQVLETAK